LTDDDISIIVFGRPDIIEAILQQPIDIPPSEIGGVNIQFGSSSVKVGKREYKFISSKNIDNDKPIITCLPKRKEICYRIV
jgi:hypothetical protein